MARSLLLPLVLLLLAPPSSAQGGDLAPDAPAVRLTPAPGTLALEGTAWAWTGEAVVVFGAPDGDGGRPVLLHDPVTGETRTSVHRIPADAGQVPGQAVAFGGRVYLLGLARTDCPTDACFLRGLETAYLYEPAGDVLEEFRLDGPAPLDAVAVAADDAVYLFGGGLGSTQVTRFDPATGEVRQTGDELPAPVAHASRADAVWTGSEVVILTRSSFDAETETWPNVLAYDPASGRSRVVGSQGYAMFAGDPAAAWDGREVWVAGGRASAGQVPPGSVVAIDPVAGTVREVAAVPDGAVAAGLLRIGGRFLVLGMHDGCGAPWGAVWMEPGAPDGRGAAPVARMAHRVGYYNEERGEFLVVFDLCGSTDGDGLVVTYRPPRTDFYPPGEHTVSGRVWDDDGLFGEAELSFRLDARPPVASWTWRVVDHTVVVDASASHDPTEELMEFWWDWGDGQYTQTSLPDGSAGPHPVRTEHAYDEPGRYNVTLAVVAEDGQRDVSGRVLEVGEARGTQPPGPPGPSPSDPEVPGEESPSVPWPVVAFLGLGAALLRRRA